MRDSDLEQQWPYVLTLLPANLEASARESGALVRARGVPNAEALLRVVLAYALSDLSMKDVAAWAEASGLAEITASGVFYRVREAEGWLSELLGRLLEQEVPSAQNGVLWARIVDATVITGPGAQGTEWRAHVLADPATGGFRAVELTDARVGESYALHPMRPGEVVLGDRGYARARGIWAATQRGAEVVVRVNPHAIRLCGPDRTVLRVLEEEHRVGPTGVMTFDIIIPIPPESATRSHKTWPLSRAIDWVPARLAAARTRRNEVIWVLTTLPADRADPAQVMDLYRLRWQVELLFKRLKSLLHLDSLPSRQGPTARSWMLARLLGAALAQKLVRPSGAFPPWGYRLR